jgi:hypothetical protein
MHCVERVESFSTSSSGRVAEGGAFGKMTRAEEGQVTLDEDIYGDTYHLHASDTCSSLSALRLACSESSFSMDAPTLIGALTTSEVRA